ncbi:MAG: DUF5996 family protein [Anaerolineaceae bacterium]|nr:DUF5996 family protein [Anaerolineaceae bacterium]
MSTVYQPWPELPLDEWQDTFTTLHLWSQIVGKIRLSQAPWTNHSWHVPLYLTSRGLTTSPIAYAGRLFDIDFDFVDHQLLICVNDGSRRAMPLRTQTVADFYHALMDELEGLGIHVDIHGRPNEVDHPIPFSQDRQHAAYDPEYANRAWRILLQADRVFKQFRTRFSGKNSPVHFFWGSFDLAVTRFSGRPAPLHPGGVPNLPDWVTREAYSHEVSSAGFWPGGGPHPFPLFYSYAYPEPQGFSTAAVRPAQAFYSHELREFILPYAAVRTAAAPDDVLLDFLQSTYAAAADHGAWDRAALECDLQPRPGAPGT